MTNLVDEKRLEEWLISEGPLLPSETVDVIQTLSLSLALKVVRACQMLYIKDGTRWKKRWNELRVALAPFSVAEGEKESR